MLPPYISEHWCLYTPEKHLGPLFASHFDCLCTPFCKLKYFPFCQCDAKRSKLLFECKVMPIYSFHLFRINPTKNSLENHQCVKNKYLAYEVCMNQISYMVKVMRSLWTWKCYSNIPDYENEPLLAVKEIIYNMTLLFMVCCYCCLVSLSSEHPGNPSFFIVYVFCFVSKQFCCDLL